jgi:predicted deacetylase
MTTTYIFRLDDVSPVMNWNKFWALVQLFSKHGVKPLLGVIPDNQDPRLSIEPYRHSFWQTIRQLVTDDLVDIAQHGYQHILQPRYTQRTPLYLMPNRPYSEFVGEPLEIQLDKIYRGKQILAQEGLETSYWMAPNHSLDRTTLRALRIAGFRAATDGIALHPFIDEGILFIPQQTWKPRWTPGGIQTVCLHSDFITVQEIKRLRLFLRRPRIVGRFSSLANQAQNYKDSSFGNTLFRAQYGLLRHSRNLKRRLSTSLHKPSSTGTPLVANNTQRLKRHCGDTSP